MSRAALASQRGAIGRDGVAGRGGAASTRGIASLAPDDSSDAIMARADRALYAAKAGGRNRIASDQL